MMDKKIENPIFWQDFLRICHKNLIQAYEILFQSIDLISLISIPAPSQTSTEIYGRKLLYQDHEGEVLLMTWQEDRFCAPHDHEASQGCVFFLQGHFLERQWLWQEQTLRLGPSQEISSPTSVPVEAGRIHDMKAVNQGVSLHVYFPPICKMKVFDVKNQMTYLVGQKAGAWLPVSEENILKGESWGLVG